MIFLHKEHKVIFAVLCVCQADGFSESFAVDRNKEAQKKAALFTRRPILYFGLI